MANNRLVIGMSGASGAPLTVELLWQLKTYHPEVETHLIVTKGGEMTLQQELEMSLDELKEMATCYHSNSNIGAPTASGSFRTMGMIVVPCSMKTVAGIVSGYSDNLLLRTADVMMKERRKLVLVAREAPLSTIHLRNLCEASKNGAVILPPMMTYYNHPKTLEDCTRHTVNRILSQFDLDEGSYQWEGMDEN
jgi:polyprenyl P-hydroxybenzoate/phenylacrylic acid decarboxylase-like protein